MTSYKSGVELGRGYRDEQTGYVGVATSVTFFQHACERVALEAYDSDRKEVKVEIFDAPRLRDEKTLERVVADRPGGPGMPNAQAGYAGR